MIAAVASLAALAALVLPAGAQAVPQTWVSGVGDDANPCSRTAPCKTFAGAISKTDTGGVISVLDPGGFGTVTITKSITIDGHGSFGGVLASLGNTGAIIVNAPAGSTVVLRGLTIQFAGGCTSPGTGHAIVFTSGGVLHVEDVNINGFPGAAIDDEPSVDGTSLTVSNSELRDNCTGGLIARRASGHVDATLSSSFLANDATGVLAGAGSDVRISGNTIVGNTVGLAVENAAALESFGDNRVAGNTTNGAPTIELNAPPPAPPITTPAPTPAPTPPPAPKTPAPCVVPNLGGLSLADATTQLVRAHCAVGSVHFKVKHGRHYKRNRIYAQSPKHGTTLAANGKVDVTVNAKRPRGSHTHKPRAKAAFGGAPRTWVSGVGDDANPCSRTAPCATLAGAITKTQDKGIVDVLDPGNFGPVTIGQGITIDAAGNAATIVANAGTAGIVVNPGVGEPVILRGFTIISSPGCSAPGAGDGISVQSGSSLHLENVSIHGFAGAGINVNPNASEPITVHNGGITDNCTAGISVQRPGGQADVTVQGTTLSNDNTGVLAGDGSLVRTSLNTITGNNAARAKAGTGALQSWGDDHVSGNASVGPAPLSLPFL